MERKSRIQCPLFHVLYKTVTKRLKRLLQILKLISFIRKQKKKLITKRKDRLTHPINQNSKRRYPSQYIEWDNYSIDKLDRIGKCTCTITALIRRILSILSSRKESEGKNPLFTK